MNLFPLNTELKKKKNTHLKSVATEGFFFLFLNQENKLECSQNYYKSQWSFPEMNI